MAGGNNLPSANWIPTNLRNPRQQQWNLTFEQQLPHASSVRVSYIGAHQSGQILGLDAAFLAPNNNPFGTSTDPDRTHGHRRWTHSVRSQRKPDRHAVSLRSLPR